MRPTNRPVTIIALLLGMFMAALEMTVVSTAMPTVVSELGGIQRYAWVFTAYMLASTISVPIYGKLADLHGRKPLLLLGLGLFLLGSTACGMARSMDALVLFRVLQGLGAGAIQPIALTVIGDMFDLHERARIQGLFGGMWGLAGMLGPLAGGLIVKHLSWHWVFFINLPFGLLSAVLLWVMFHESIERAAGRPSFDLAGSALLTAGVIALLVGVQGHGHAAVALPVAAIALVAFVWAERRTREPVFPLRMFATPAIVVSSVAGGLFSAAMFGAVTYVPLFVQGVLGGSPTDAGGMITPMIVAWPICSTLSGRLLPRIGFRPLIVGGLAVAAVANLGMALLLKPDAPILVARVAMGLFGAGLGFTSTALLIAVQTSVGWEMRGVATASNMFFRTVGGALGVGLMGGVLLARLSKDPTIPTSAVNELLGPGHGQALPPGLLRSLSGALESGLAVNFWIMSALAACAFVAGLLFPRAQKTDPHAAQGV